MSVKTQFIKAMIITADRVHKQQADRNVHDPEVPGEASACNLHGDTLIKDKPAISFFLLRQFTYTPPSP